MCQIVRLLVFTILSEIAKRIMINTRACDVVRALLSSFSSRAGGGIEQRTNIPLSLPLLCVSMRGDVVRVYLRVSVFLSRH